MFHIHSSNRLERLAQGYVQSCQDEGLAPLASRHVLVESASLGRWLRNRVCFHDGVVCLMDTPLPAAWLWQQARQTLGLPAQDDPLNRERMQWRIHAVLDSGHPAWSDPVMKPLRRYLENDATGLKRWQLAGRIADVFDRYQYYRPEFISGWSRGDMQEDDWQALIWRHISADIGMHRVALMQGFIERLDNENGVTGLPPRVDLFGFHNLPPLFLRAFEVISRHVAVHFWLLSPTDAYWADLVTPREMARKRLLSPEEYPLWQAGNPLLTQWGRQGQVMQDLLLERDQALAISEEYYEAPQRNSLLGQLQADIHEAVDQDTTETIEVRDAPSLPSVRIHRCHSAMRECQVIRDEILRSLEEDTTLQPEDILVMVPEIRRYTPFIEAVFGQGVPRLPFRINDTSRADEQPLGRVFLDLLELPRLRFTRAEVLGLLEVEEIRHRFGLDETAASELAALFDRVQVYWGLSGEDKATRLGLPATEENTWRHARQRLLAGYALGEERLWEGIAPAPGMSAGDGAQIAGFFDLLDTLHAWSGRLGGERTPEAWAATLADLLDDLFARTSGDTDRLDAIHELVAELGSLQDTSPAPLGLAVIRHWFQQQLESRPAQGATFYSGGITFCGMKPLRGVPFRVIFLMGLQEGAYPRRRMHPEFDRMAQSWRHGDPDPVLEDRYLFLETLLAARQRFVMSYTGRGIRDDSDMPPSVILQELIDYITLRYRLPWPLEVDHPLQPFSLRNYPVCKDEPAIMPGFDAWWMTVGKAVHHHRPVEKIPAWPAFRLEPPGSFRRVVSVDRLTAFLARPLESFLRSRLRLHRPDETGLADDEPFSLQGLNGWKAGELMLQAWLRREEPAGERIQAQGLLPHGAHAEIALEEKHASLSALMEQVAHLREEQVANIDIDLTLPVPGGDAWQLTGRLRRYYPGVGLVHVNPGKFKPERLLTLWVEHLCLHAMRGVSLEARLYHPDSNGKVHCWIIPPLTQDVALDFLAALLDAYEAGQHRPLPLHVGASFKYAEVLLSSDDENRARNEAMKVMMHDFAHRQAMARDYYTQLLLRRHEPAFDDDCARLARQVVMPLVQHLNGGNPA